MGLAPSPQFPERPGTQYERKTAPSIVGQRGPLRFEEGLGTDTDIPNEFNKGALQGYTTPPGRPNHNMNVYEKPAAETMQERAHAGSAAWVEAPEFLGEYSQGSFTDFAQVRYEEVTRNGARQQHRNPATVRD